MASCLFVVCCARCFGVRLAGTSASHFVVRYSARFEHSVVFRCNSCEVRKARARSTCGCSKMPSKCIPSLWLPSLGSRDVPLHHVCGCGLLQYSVPTFGYKCFSVSLMWGRPRTPRCRRRLRLWGLRGVVRGYPSLCHLSPPPTTTRRLAAITTCTAAFSGVLCLQSDIMQAVPALLEAALFGSGPCDF